MTGNLKTAFDGIRAEDKLKTDTLLYLRNEMRNETRNETRKRETVGVRNHVRRFAVAVASVAVIALSGAFTYNLYFTPSAYVDVDVNPSVELSINRFDRVIDAHAYNEDGERILSGLSLNHKYYEDALIDLMDAINQKGYIQNDRSVTVTLQTDETQKESDLLTNIQSGVAGYMEGHHYGVQIDVFSVSGNTRSYAHEHGVSPAKYLAIQELIEVDPTATVQSCRDHSISEIRQLTQDHAGNHHSGGNAGSDEEPLNTNSNHHGENDTGGHHGEGHE